MNTPTSHAPQGADRQAPLGRRRAVYDELNERGRASSSEQAGPGDQQDDGQRQGEQRRAGRDGDQGRHQHARPPELTGRG